MTAADEARGEHGGERRSGRPRRSSRSASTSGCGRHGSSRPRSLASRAVSGGLVQIAQPARQGVPPGCAGARRSTSTEAPRRGTSWSGDCASSAARRPKRKPCTKRLPRASNGAPANRPGANRHGSDANGPADDSRTTDQARPARTRALARTPARIERIGDAQFEAGIRPATEVRALIHPFVQIILLRMNPQDLPASGTLLALALIAHAAAGAALASVNLRFDHALTAGVVETALMCGLTAGLLMLRTLSERIIQTLTALAGAGALVGFAAFPVAKCSITRTWPASRTRCSRSSSSCCSAGAWSFRPTSFATRCPCRTTSACSSRPRSTGSRSGSWAACSRSPPDPAHAHPLSRHLRHLHVRARGDRARARPSGDRIRPERLPADGRGAGPGRHRSDCGIRPGAARTRAGSGSSSATR